MLVNFLSEMNIINPNRKVGKVASLQIGVVNIHQLADVVPHNFPSYIYLLSDNNRTSKVTHSFPMALYWPCRPPCHALTCTSGWVPLLIHVYQVAAVPRYGLCPVLIREYSCTHRTPSLPGACGILVIIVSNLPHLQQEVYTHGQTYAHGACVI